jgi:hypothetical protein
MAKTKTNGRTKDSFRKEARFPYSVNSRKSFMSGLGMPTVATLVGDDGFRVVKRISPDSVPMNFLPVAVGAAAVRKVVFKGDETIVIFDGGEKVSVVRSENDKYDEATAVAWAILKFSFGKNFNRQIHKIIEKVGVYADKLHAAKGKDDCKDCKVVKASLTAKSKTRRRTAKKTSK